MIYRFLFALLVCSLSVLSVPTFAQTSVHDHQVQSGETLYSLSRKYGVSVEAIRQANPLLGEHLLAGQNIHIPIGMQSTATPVPSSSTTNATTAVAVTPQSSPTGSRTQQRPECKLMYEVGKKETVYSISHKFGITEEALRSANPQIERDKVKKGEYLCIPFTAEEVAVKEQQRAQAEEQVRQEAIRQEQHAQKYATLRAMVILPFDLAAETKSNEAVKMLDFYSGVLLAANELKARGYNIDLYAYDEAAFTSATLDSLFQLPEIQQLHLIIGPMRSSHIYALSRFAKEHDICLAVPFSTRSDITDRMPTTFQVNTSATALYPQVYDQFIAQCHPSDVVFVSSDDRGSKADYIAGFKQVLARKNVPFSQIDMDQLATTPDSLHLGANTILVPTSSSVSTFETMMRHIGRNPVYADRGASIFGYPEWQTLSDRHRQNAQKHHIRFYATFYADKDADNVRTFTSKFNNAFQRQQYASTPLFGLLGYDVANYFLQGIKRHGDAFLTQLNDNAPTALQNTMHFERRNENSGYVNTHLSIIRF